MVREDLLLEVRGLELAAPDGSRPVRRVDLSLRGGESLALVGESGSGKSLTALSLTGLLPVAISQIGGSISLQGRRIDVLSDKELTQIRGAEIAMVSQDPMSSLNPVRRIGHQIVEAIRAHSDVSRSAAIERAVELLAAVGFEDAARSALLFPHELSGGMRQRVVIAMALSMEPALIIADEPTTALDVATEWRVLELLFDLATERSVAVILITHDLGIAARYCSSVRVMYAGQVVEFGPVERVFKSPSHPYTRSLLDATFQVDGPLPSRLTTIAGQPPTPGSLGIGCAFAPRCFNVTPHCLEIDPPMRASDGRGAACLNPVDRDVEPV